MTVIRTVLGDIHASDLGVTLPHEHLLAGFNPYGVTADQYDDDDVVKRMLPYLSDLYKAGGRALIECTPDYLGRDLPLWRRLSRESGLHILGSTGAYFEPFIPDYARNETTDMIAKRWIKEANEGIGGVMPGFIKIGMSGKAMTMTEQNILNAALLTSEETGLVVAAHCPSSAGMRDAIAIMRAASFDAERFIWVHADAAWMKGAEGEEAVYDALEQGYWIEIDTIGSCPYQKHAEIIQKLFTHDARLLISQDAGWYTVGKPEAPIRDYASLLTDFLPSLPTEMAKILVVRNPALAFRIRG